MALDMNGQEMPTKKLPSVEQNMLAILQSMSDLTPTHFPFVGGIYGDMGTGKTVTGMKLLQDIVPDNQLILYIYTAAGLSTFNNHPELMRRVKTMKFERQEQLVVVAESIAKAKKDEALNPGKNGPLSQALSRFGGVMLDEYTHMSKIDQSWIVRTRAQQAEENKTFKDPHNPTLPDYLTQQARSNEVINGFMNSGVHFVAICHQRFDDKTAVYRPDFPQATGADLFRVLHSMYYAQSDRNKKNEPVKLLHMHAGKNFVAKNRIGGLGAIASVEEIVAAYEKWGINTEAADNAVAPIETPKVETPSETTPEPVVEAESSEYQQALASQHKPPVDDDDITKLLV